jgi:hypothetical protein
MTKSTAVTTGIIGLIAALLTGTGEFILHYDALARFSENQFFLGIGVERTNWGHFIAVLGAPLYLVGCWHIQLMLRPANPRWSMTAFFVMAYGFLVGIVWIGSRASISALINLPASPEIEGLVALYDLRYESLLQVIRIAVLILSVIFVWLTLTGRSHYPKWMAVLNPILLIVASFVVYVVAPEFGKYLMPIALNVAFAVFFIASIRIAIKGEI